MDTRPRMYGVNRARIFGIWATAWVPVVLALLSAGCSNREELEPRAVSPMTPDPMIHRGPDLEDPDMTAADYRERRSTVPPTVVPPVTDTTDDSIRQRDIEQPPPAPEPRGPGATAVPAGQTPGAFVPPATPPARSNGYYQDGVWVPAAGVVTPNPQGTNSTETPATPPTPATPAADPAPGRANAQPIRERQRDQIESQNGPARSNGTPEGTVRPPRTGGEGGGAAPAPQPSGSTPQPSGAGGQTGTPAGGR